MEGIALLEEPIDQAYIDTPNLDGALLLAEVLSCRREDLLDWGNQPLSPEDHARFKALLDRRRSGECVAYILGHKEFWGLTFIVNPQVLVPRPDTETLVEAALAYLDSLEAQSPRPGETLLEPGPQRRPLRVLDLCTGSGAIAVSLKHERPLLSVAAADISAAALEVAAANAERLLEAHTGGITFYESDLLAGVPGTFDMIVTNPPYIPSDHIVSLAPETQGEPHIALDGGEEGLDLVEGIISQGRTRLEEGGIIFLEADPSQMEDIAALFRKYGYGDLRLYQALSGSERVISARWGGGA